MKKYLQKFGLLRGYSERLIRFRTDMGYDKNQLAGKLKITRGALSRLECGSRFPGIGLLCALYETCDVSLNWLLFGRGARTCKENDEGFALKEEVLRLREELREKPALIDKAARVDALQAETERYRERAEAHDRTVARMGNPDDLDPKIVELITAMGSDDILFHKTMLLFGTYKNETKNEPNT